MNINNNTIIIINNTDVESSSFISFNYPSNFFGSYYISLTILYFNIQLPGTIYSSPGPFHPSHDTFADLSLNGYGKSVLHSQTGF